MNAPLWPAEVLWLHTIVDTVWITKAGIRAIRPAPAYRVLIAAVRRSDEENVTLTGLEAAADTAVPRRSVPVMFWSAFKNTLEVRNHDTA